MVPVLWPASASLLLLLAAVAADILRNRNGSSEENSPARSPATPPAFFAFASPLLLLDSTRNSRPRRTVFTSAQLIRERIPAKARRLPFWKNQIGKRQQQKRDDYFRLKAASLEDGWDAIVDGAGECVEIAADC